MKKVQKTIDTNAHIEGVTCKIVVEDGYAVALISFCNLGYGDITAIKFSAIGYNSFGDIVSVKGKERFFLIIQDLSIKKNEEVENLKVRLPVSDIRKLEIEEAQICYADGAVLTYEGENIIHVELNEWDESDGEQLAALKKMYDNKAKYLPLNIADGWICTCGRFNRLEAAECSLCGKKKDKTFAAVTQDGIRQMVDEYHEALEKEREATKLKEAEAEKARKKRNRIIGLGILVAIVIVCILVNAAVLSQRQTFDSVEEMQDAITGTYVYYDGYEAERVLFITDDLVKERFLFIYSDSDDIDFSIESWNPHRGKITLYFSEIVVQNDGNLLYDGDVYERDDSWFLNSDDTTSDVETGYDALEITDLELTSDSSYTICTGKVKNTGKRTYSFIEVKGSFKDEDGNVLDTDWTYASGSEGLEPGESTEFRLSVTKDYNIDSCSVKILDYDD